MVEALARPPTPPRTSSRTLAHDEKDQTEDSPVILQTPGASPFSVNGSAGDPSTRQSKRVNFSPWTRYIKPPSFANTNTAWNPKPELKALPPSNECKPSKSILKATNTNAPVHTPNLDPLTPESFVMLLESVVQQLAGESDTGRLDAYMHFFGVLKTYEGVPGQQEISGKLGLITQFIQRDVTRNLENGGPVDINLVCQALKLATALVWHIELSAQLPDDFKIFLVDHSISCLHDAKVSKSVLTHCMSILATQNFGPKIMSNARLIRLLTALHDITDRVNGNAILSQRLSIYQRILNQSQSTFISQSALWMEPLISSLLHPFKDARSRAIFLGSQASMAIGPNSTLSKTIREILDRPLDNGRKLVSEVCERMSRMMASVDSGIHVPQVWSVIILLLRNKKTNIEQWEHFKEWVLVLQKCFNCSESAIKAQAIMGWNRFVFVVGPSETTSLTIVKMLSKPILSQFERKKQDKHGPHPSQLAMSSYYNLLYYAFHPSASHQFLDTVWGEYIASPSSIIFASNSILSDRVSHALSNMLWSSHVKVWTDKKVNESSKLDPVDLPTLDCKWTRSRITSILKVFESLFRSSIWVDDAIGQSNIAAAWVSLANSLSYASSKEITPTPESMQAVANVLGLLQHLWNAGPSSLNAVGDHSMDTFFERFRFLSTTMIFSLGSIPFTEKLLFKTAEETFQAATTPTHRDQRGNANLDIPILHFLRLISDVSGISEPTPAYLRLIIGTLEAACNGRVSRGSRLELLRQCADLYPNEAEFHFGVHNFAQIVWKSTAQLAADTLCSFPMESARERDGSVSRDYENIVNILSSGLKFVDISLIWSQLLDSSVRVVRTERGDRAIATMILEPLAERVTRLKARDTYLPSISLLNHSLSISYYYPDASKMGPNGAENGVHSAGNDELLLPEKLLALVYKTLQESYEGFDPSNTKGVADFIESLTSFLGSGALVFRSTVLERLQGPLAQWLKDEVRQLNVESGVESRILTACRALSSAVLNVLQVSAPNNASCLQTFYPIICAGLESSHMSIAKRFFDMFNAVSKSDGSLACFETTSRALQKLEPFVNAQTPVLPLPHDTKVPIHPESAGPSADNGNSTAISANPPRLSVPGNSLEASTGLDSSPVVMASETATGSSEGQNQPVLQAPSQAEDTDALAFVQDSAPILADTETRNSRDEMFSMIEGLRSSSPPANTPNQLQFMTPPHLRTLRNTGADAEPPLTPTLAAISAENEDVFLGSSPTPSARNRPQSSQSRNSSSQRKRNIDIHASKDPPSSPPELKSPSPNSHQRPQSPTPNKSKHAHTEPRVPRDGQTEQFHVNTTPAEQPSTRRLRSSASKKSKSNRKSSKSAKSSASPEKTSTGPVQVENTQPRTRASKTNPESNQFQIEKADEEPSQFIVDSYSEDVESQVASQLEQDLELAVDHDDKPKTGAEQLTELPHSFPMANKRKRDMEETQNPPSRKEKRRSTRLSSQPAAVDITPERRTTRWKALVSKSSQEASSAQSSPAARSASKRRKGQSDTGESVRSKSAGPEQIADGKMEKTPEASESSQKRRRSSRLGRNAAEVVPEETPSRKKSPRDTRSRKQKVSEEPSQETSQNEDQAPDSHPEGETPGAEGVTAQEAVGQEGPEAQVEHVETQESSRSGPLLEQIAETQPGIQTNQTEQAPTETDVQMEDAEPSPQPEVSTEEENDISKTTETEQQIASTSVEKDSRQTDIIRSFKQTLDDLKSAALDENSFREIDELLFKIRVEAHDAFRRYPG